MDIDTIYFEGPEKKLEIILVAPQPGLRDNGDGRWDRVVRASGASIVSRVTNAQADAYLLSESSLFVWDDAVLMITCGQTTLVRALREILRFVDRDRIAFVFYERKNFIFPDRQPSDFEADAAELSAVFPGKSYRLGPANHDHLHVFYYHAAGNAPERDATLQILMSDLHPAVMDPFSVQSTPDPETARRRAGLDRFYPDALTDGYLFAPCGYSLNGIRGPEYFTVHVTPQAAGSYTSFETNIVEPDYSRLIRDVVAIFRPKTCSIALTTTLHEQCQGLHGQVGRALPGYRMTERSLYEFDCGYMITFMSYGDQAEETQPP